MEITRFFEFREDGRRIIRVVECMDPGVVGRTIEHTEKKAAEGGGVAV